MIHVSMEGEILDIDVVNPKMKLFWGRWNQQGWVKEEESGQDI